MLQYMPTVYHMTSHDTTQLLIQLLSLIPRLLPASPLYCYIT